MLSISRYALGSPKNLIFEDGTSRWDSEQLDRWVLGDPHAARSVLALFETLGIETPSAIPAEYEKSMEGLARGRIPWPLVIPAGALRDHAERVDSMIEEAIERLGDYSETLARSRRILEALQPCRVDLAALRVCQGESASLTLDSFEPGPDSMVQPPIYSHATATGRLTVREGPRILTLQKDHRRIMSSRYDGGQMVQIDFVSLEPRVLRLLRAGVAPIDIYSDVSDRLGGAANRRQVKLATLKMLYGSSRAGIAEDVGSLSSASIKQIEDYFGLSTLRARLSSELGKQGMIRSHWGRPLPEAQDQHLLVSHFTQSTAVDVALGGFGDILDRIKELDLNVVPCFVLHDALLLDVHPDSMAQLEQIASVGVDVDGLGHFEVSLSPAYVSQELV